MELKRIVYETIKKHNMFTGKTNVVLGFSGGPDSLALFNCLFELSRDFIKSNGKFGCDLVIYPVHINHNLRGEDSNLDEKFSVEFSKKLNLEYPNIVKECEVFSFDCNKYSIDNKMSTEEAGRSYRYSKFLEVSKRLENSVISVAQNKNDQAETILFRIIRGTSIKGMSGISYVRDLEGIRVIRPLLDSSRDDIISYLDSIKLVPRIDKTNLENDYQRNKIRNELLPILKEYNPDIIDSLVRMSDSINPINEYLKEEARKKIKEICHSNSINVKNLKEIHIGLRYQIYLEILNDIGMKEDITKYHLDKIDSMTNPTNHKITTIELSNGFRVTKENGIIQFKYIED